MPEALHLDGGGMTELPESLRANTALPHLDVRSNRLAKLPAWLAELPALESLSIGDNPPTTALLRCPMRSVRCVRSATSGRPTTSSRSSPAGSASCKSCACTATR
jgi:hypothetical protein